MSRHGSRRDGHFPPVVEPHGDARPHVALEIAGDGRVHHEAHALHERPDGRIVRFVIAKSPDAHAPLAERGRGRELARELGLEPAPGIGVDENARDGGVDAHRDLRYLLGRDLVRALELEGAVDDGMGAGA